MIASHPEGETANPVQAADLLALVIDQFVMKVTEALCSLEREAGIAGPEEEERKAYIRSQLDHLEQITVAYRSPYMSSS